MTNARSTMSPLDLALSYIARGWNPVPVSRKTKKPIGKEWQNRVLTAKTAARHFNGSAINVGELSSLTTSCARPTSGCPDTKNIAPAHSPSTRKIGIPAPSRPANSATKPATLAAQPVAGSSLSPGRRASIVFQAGEISSVANLMM